jgi:hypothetical protein
MIGSRTSSLAAGYQRLLPRFFLAPFCAGLAACATPDLTQELGSFSESAIATNRELVEFATPRAAAEQNRARLAALQAGRSPITLSCEIGTPLNECVIFEAYELPDTDGVWTSTLAFTTALSRYLAAFEALLKVETPAEIGTRTTVLFQAVGGFADTPSAGLPASTTARATAVSNPIGVLAAQAARARQYRALRQAAEPADQAIGNALAALQTQGLFPESERAFEALIEASRALETKDSPTIADVRLVETRRTAYLEAVRETPLETFLLMREAHAGLLSALNRNANPTEVLNFVNALNDLNSALEET